MFTDLDLLSRNISAKGARWPSGVICRNSLLKPHLNFTIYAETTFCVTHLSLELPSTPVRNTILSISWFKPSTELRIDDLGIGFTGIVTGSTFRVGDRMYAVNCFSKKLHTMKISITHGLMFENCYLKYFHWETRVDWSILLVFLVLN